MGRHLNYYLIIEQLVTLKNEFHRITDEKYQPVIGILRNLEVYHRSDNEHLPNHKLLATKLNYTQSKMNSLLKGLLHELIQDFNVSPFKVENVVHQVLIYIPWDERQSFKNKEFAKEVSTQSSYIEMELPVTPRLGEEIEIPILQETGNFYSGYIHRIKHRINGQTQEITYFIHPWDNYYCNWKKMEEEYARRHH